MITQAFLTVSFVFFLPVLDFLWPFMPVSNACCRFLVNFLPSASLSFFRNLFEVPLDPQRTSSARTLSPCRATWDWQEQPWLLWLQLHLFILIFGLIPICTWNVKKTRISLGQELHLFCIFPGQSRAMGCYVWATPKIPVLGETFEQSVQTLFLGWDFI